MRSRNVLGGRIALGAVLSACFGLSCSGEPESEPGATAGSGSSVGGTGGTGEAGEGNGGNAACTTGRAWNPDETNEELRAEGPWMNPGRACIACHLTAHDRGPLVQLGGTVYPARREPDLCYGVDGRTTDARVIITDARERVFELSLGPTGNFSLSVEEEAVTFPIRAKIVYEGRERLMAIPQESGDCNGCHTPSGENGAPGRIVLP